VAAELLEGLVETLVPTEGLLSGVSFIAAGLPAKIFGSLGLFRYERVHVRSDFRIGLKFY
jgi:hypothetical protein